MLSRGGRAGEAAEVLALALAHAPRDTATQASELLLGQHAFPLVLRRLLAAAADPCGDHAVGISASDLASNLFDTAARECSPPPCACYPELQGAPKPFSSWMF